MLVAIGTLDGKKINPDHFGQSRVFVIFNYNNKTFEKIDERKNPYAENHLHAKVDEILELLRDCKVWIGKIMGKGSMKKLQKLGYKPILINAKTVEETLKELSKKI
ncbi:MAG: dinitrogenase iron-molybdenum cofactor biosynthesis protein [Thermosipho sp. (in: Bacteria)]|nr:dinitrogenase iron-molybdenum cofactor biosynthesis protein [Thermosipho sp. (in: thermotogales)]